MSFRGGRGGFRGGRGGGRGGSFGGRGGGRGGFREPEGPPAFVVGTCSLEKYTWIYMVESID